MRIQSIRVENFRAFKDETVIFDDYTCFVGPNGAGKSTVLCALNVFFRENENSSTDMLNLSEEDFHQRNTSEPIKITVTFVDLSDEAKVDFKDYYRNDKLIIAAVATYDASSKHAEVKQYGERLGLKEFMPFFDAISTNAKVAELKSQYEILRSKFPTLPPPGSKDAMIDALHVHESSNPGECIPIPSEDQFYGVSRGTNRLYKYVQWVYVPAVKDVTTEQAEGKTTALGKLLARTVRLKLKFDEVMAELREKTETEYKKILDDHQGQLTDLERSLGEKLSLWAHPDAKLKLEWQKDSKSAVEIQLPNAKTVAGEGMFEGDMARLGNGFQRSYLLAVLQVLATTGDESAPCLILGCEEPELYQHPPQARHLAAVFEELAGNNAQIIISTHSPVFVTGKNFESVRMVRFNHDTESSQIKQLTFDKFASAYSVARGEAPRRPTGIMVTLHQALQPNLNEIFFAKYIILVEGLEDVAYLTSWLVLTGRWETYRKLGMHIVAANGKGQMCRPLLIAKELCIPIFTVFDADGDKLDKNGEHLGAHKSDNETLLKILGDTSGKPFPAATLWGGNYVVWPTNIGDVVSNEIPAEDRPRYEEAARLACGQVADIGKNGIYIGELLSLVHEAGVRPPSLEKICELIIKDGEVHNA